MDVSRFREFIVLSQCLNYSKAANQLYITQPVLSRHIHDLEDFLGVQLLIRDTHNVQLTTIGELAVKEFTAALEEFDSAIIKIQSASDTLNSSISLGFLGYAVKGFITNFLGKFEKVHPTVKITLSSSSLDSLISAVLNKELDIAFTTHVSSNNTDKLESRHISDEELCVVLPYDHPLCKKNEVFLSELEGEYLITFSSKDAPFTNQFHSDIFEKHGVHVKSAKKITNVESGFFYVHMGAGIFLIPRHLSFMAEDHKVVPIADPDIKVPLYLIWHRDNTTAALKTFINEFTKFYKDEF